MNVSNVVTFEVKIEVTGRGPLLLKPEMTANVEIVAAEKTDVLTVPAEAVVRKGRKQFATVVKNGQEEQRRWRSGISDGMKTEVVSGLSEGETVLVHARRRDSRWNASRAAPRPRRDADDTGRRRETAMIIEAQGLIKHYRMGGSSVAALDGVDLTVEAGEMVAITGPSGSGKSTLMHILGCLDHPDSGRYVLAGEDVSRLSGDRLAEIRNRRIGFVFQTFNLLPRLNALENVELPLLYAGLPHARQRAYEALEAVGLTDRMHHRPNQLSGGQRQRVAIARSIITNPAIILADEPTGNLDTRTGEEILALFVSLNASGRTILIVTHEHDIASRCRRQIAMRDGRIVSETRS